MIYLLLAVHFLFSTSELEKRSLLDNKIEILVPKGFAEMSQDLINLKYPGKNRPRLILTDQPGTTNIAFTLTESPADSSLIDEYLEMVVKSYKKSFPDAEWKRVGVELINGRKVGCLRLISQAIDQKLYNYIFLTDVDSKLLVGTFNCTLTTLPQWEATADTIVHSLKVKPQVDGE